MNESESARESEGPAMVIRPGPWPADVLRLVCVVAGASNVDQVLVCERGRMKGVAGRREPTEPRKAS